MSKKIDFEEMDRNFFEEMEKKAVVVTDDVGLKTEMGKEKQCILSRDPELYRKMIQKFTKHKVSRTTKGAGKVAFWTGVGITVLSSGILSGIGLPLAGAGAVANVSGRALDEYKNYRLYIDYDSRAILFVRK